MATLTTQPMVTGGLALTEASAGGSGDRFTPGDKTFLYIRNTDSASHTVTVVTPGTVAGLAIADVGPVTVAAGAIEMIPIPAALFASSDGLGDVSYSATTGMKVAVVSVP